MSKQSRYQSLILQFLIFNDTNCILTTILNLGNVQCECLLNHVIMIFKLLMILISIIMMLVMISDQVGALEVDVQGPSAYGHVPAFTNPIPSYGKI